MAFLSNINGFVYSFNFSCMKKMIAFCFTLFALQSFSQSKKMDFEQYDPPSTLVVPEHKPTKSKFPFIDVHNHQFSMPTQDISSLLKEMDQLNMKVMVNLSGRSYKSVNGQFGLQDNEYLVNAIKQVKKSTPNRIIQFTNVSFIGAGSQGWVENALKELEEDVRS